MTEIKKATIDDVDVGRFESKINRPVSGYNFSAPRRTMELLGDA